MEIGLSRIAWMGPGRAGGWPWKARPLYPRSGLLWLPLIVIAGLVAWMWLYRYGNPAAGEPMHLSKAVIRPASPTPPDAAQQEPVLASAITPEEMASAGGLKISSQHWRRGGLGSNALVTFTLRNRNDFAVKDIEISCTFARRDGSHLTDRARMIHDTVNMKGKRRFAHLHIGFVNIHASNVKCAPVAASRA
ncbi:MAG: hypothetical protein ACREC2_14510 [Bradyrhizobium sp.]